MLSDMNPEDSRQARHLSVAMGGVGLVLLILALALDWFLGAVMGAFLIGWFGCAYSSARGWFDA